MPTFEKGSEISGILTKEIPEVFGWRQRFATLVDYLFNPEKYPPMPKGNPRTQRSKAFTFKNGKMPHNSTEH